MQEKHSDCSRVAQQAIVLGPSGHVKPNPIVPAQFAQSVDSAVQSDPSLESVKREFSCLSPRATAIKEQGSLSQWQHFSESVNQISLCGKVDHFYKVVPQ